MNASQSNPPMVPAHAGVYFPPPFIYVAGIAAAILLNTWWALALLPVVVLIVDRSVIAREERYLAAAFPAEYGQYRQRVRRWV